MGQRRRNTPVVIGLTGNIATGKSVVGRLLAELGAEHLDADALVHAVLAPDGAAYAAVVAEFGADILTPDGAIDRRKLGDRVFADPAALAQLERLVHPPVIAEANRRIAATHAPVVVVEAIKLLESGMAKTYDAIWVTTCSEETQVARLMTTRHFDRAEALRRIHAQPPQSTKIARADMVINTEGTMEETEAQVVRAWLRIRSEELEIAEN